METLIVDIIIAAVLGMAAWRRPGCPTVWALLVAFAMSASLGPALHGTQRVAALSLIDYGIVLAMAAIWTRTHDMRAYAIGFIGWAKVGMRLGYATGLQVDHYLYAVAINCAFIAQVLVAGGVLDGVGAGLDRRLRMLFPRRYGLLRDGAR